ncbi:MAG: hypothetical protein ACLGG0_14260 [Bacteriovoracia bacterium]
MRKITTASLSLFILAGCSSAPVSTTPEAMPDKVLSRINDISSRPLWLNEEKPFEVKDGVLTSLGQTTIPGSDRVEAAYNISDNNAKGAICSAIESRLDFVFQNAEEGTAVDANQVRRIGAEACKITSSSLRPGVRYWEKVATSTDSGERVTRYKVFSTVTMPEADFRKAVMNAIKKQEGKPGISEDFSKKVDQHWDAFVQGK